jgi:hypothetical protein
VAAGQMERREMTQPGRPAVFCRFVPDPIATPANMMVMGPGGYHFGDYWKLGLPVMCWFLIVSLTVISPHGRFEQIRLHVTSTGSPPPRQPSCSA